MKIATKIRILASALALVTALTVGWVMYAGYRGSIAGLEKEVLQQRVEADVSRLEEAFKEISHDIRFLEGLPEVRGCANGSSRSRQELGDDLAGTFVQLLKAKPHYAQVRLIGAANDGAELVRVDRAGEEVVRRGEQELQRKGHRNYFRETSGKLRGEIFYSEIDLNREQGEVEFPKRPTLRVAMPVYDQGEAFWGIVIINLDFQGFAREFIGTSRERFAHYLCNSSGDYLVHPDEGKVFGFDLGERFRIQDDYPGFADFIASGDDGMTLAIESGGQSDGLWFHLERVRPRGSEKTYFYGVSARFDEVVSAFKSTLFRTALIGMLLCVVAFFGAVGLSLLITKPIERVALAARRLGEGQDDVDLPYQRKDEIGVLASSFKDMRQSIRDQECAILDANDKLTQANLDLKHFSHISSHELREPLTRIAGLASLLEREVGGESGAAANGLAKSVKREAASALQQITDFRVFSHLGAGASVREPVDLAALVREVLNEFQSKLEERKVLVALEDLPVVEGYRNLLRVLYRNLVENALKYSERDAFSLRFTCVGSARDAVLGVFNTGSSILPEYQGSLFQIFTRFHRHVEGTGIGLSICKRVVECHSGEIWVESKGDSVHIKFRLEEKENDDTEN